MKVLKVLVAVTACGLFAALSACGGAASNGGAAKEAAGTLTEANRDISVAPEAPADAATQAAGAGAADAAAKAGAEGTAADAAIADGFVSGKNNTSTKDRENRSGI
jgi:hypothetical protein